jgi:hypothetical protein
MHNENVLVRGISEANTFSGGSAWTNEKKRQSQCE